MCTCLDHKCVFLFLNKSEDSIRRWNLAATYFWSCNVNIHTHNCVTLCVGGGVLITQYKWVLGLGYDEVSPLQCGRCCCSIYSRTENLDCAGTSVSLRSGDFETGSCSLAQHLHSHQHLRHKNHTQHHRHQTPPSKSGPKLVLPSDFTTSNRDLASNTPTSTTERQHNLQITFRNKCDVSL